VTKGLSREIFAPTPYGELLRLLGDDGMSLGVWFGDRLICMRAVVTEHKWMGEILAHMGVGPDGGNRTCYTDHCIVDKEFRGNNVQFLTHCGIENYVADRFDKIYTTVAPKNIFSLQNILSCNFIIVGLKSLYGGHTRFLLSKTFKPTASLWTNGHLVVPIADVEFQKKIISQGYVGYKSIRKHRSFSILYAPLSEAAPMMCAGVD
jgi:hypothetical protein